MPKSCTYAFQWHILANYISGSIQNVPYQFGFWPATLNPVPKNIYSTNKLCSRDKCSEKFKYGKEAKKASLLVARVLDYVTTIFFESEKVVIFTIL